jgi:hypothetical protein
MCLGSSILFMLLHERVGLGKRDALKEGIFRHDKYTSKMNTIHLGHQDMKMAGERVAEIREETWVIVRMRRMLIHLNLF